MDTIKEDLLKIFKDLRTEEFGEFQWHLEHEQKEHLRAIPAFKLENASRTDTVDLMTEAYIADTIQVATIVLGKMKRHDLVKKLTKEPASRPAEIEDKCQLKLKSTLKLKFQCLFEGVPEAGNPVLLNKIYTELYITEGGVAGVNQEHEVRQLETTHGPCRPERTITCEDIFNGHPDREEPIRTVLTKGVAGIGKTVLTQKFSLDWAEGRANQDIQLLFPFTFRELNVLRDAQFSLVGLLHHFFSESAGLCSFENLQVVFIFDGLDECRLPLDFGQTQVLTETTESVSVDVLLVNLIRGTLLPSARLWITTRPAAANQIPAECVSMVTEVRGFADPQKEQYFRKRFRDEQQATAVISHIRTSRSLHIMCHIPVFCWILFTVLHHVMETGATDMLPRTLTQMYIHFLVVQAKVKNIKYHHQFESDEHWTKDNIQIVTILSKLAFEQLQKGNLIFYKSDLSECGLDIKAVSKYAGFFTAIFKKEKTVNVTIYCFIHLTVQEFLAALYVHQTFVSTGINLLKVKKWSPPIRNMLGLANLHRLHRSAVDLALDSPNGHLDLFLRFLLGLSLETDNSLLHGLLRKKRNTSEAKEKTIDYIKKKINEDLPPERSLNLFHCLNELNDRSLVQQIQQSLSSGRLDSEQLSPAQWSALVFILLSSDTDLEEFDLKKYSPSEEALLKLLPVIKKTRKLLCVSITDRKRLNSCFLSERSCEALSSVLDSPSNLNELTLSNNNLKDSGVQALSVGLESSHCKLKTLRLSGCNLSGRSCEALSSVVRCSSLRELHLCNNNLQESDLQALSAALQSPKCNMETLLLSLCNLSKMSCIHLSSALNSPSLRRLDLSNNDIRDSGVKILCAGLQSPNCELQTLSLSGCMVSEIGCASLALALSSGSSTLRELDLSYNHPGDTGVEMLWAAQRDHCCKLETLRLDNCGVHCLKPGLDKYYCELSLDPSSAHKDLKLTNNNRTVTFVEEEQPYPDHPDRFDFWRQVLCTTTLSGRCYWEAEWSREANFSVSYRDIERKNGTGASKFGLNEESWSVNCSGKWWISPNGRTLVLNHPPALYGRVAVYLDTAAGTLSFYRLSSHRRYHLHTYNVTFTKPVSAGFGFLHPDSSVSLCVPWVRNSLDSQQLLPE